MKSRGNIEKAKQHNNLLQYKESRNRNNDTHCFGGGTEGTHQQHNSDKTKAQQIHVGT